MLNDIFYIYLLVSLFYVFYVFARFLAPEEALPGMQTCRAISQAISLLVIPIWTQPLYALYLPWLMLLVIYYSHYLFPLQP